MRVVLNRSVRGVLFSRLKQHKNRYTYVKRVLVEFKGPNRNEWNKQW